MKKNKKINKKPSDKEVNHKINLIGFKEIKKFLNELKEHISIRLSNVEISMNEVDAYIIYPKTNKEKLIYNVIYIDTSQYYKSYIVNVTLRKMTFKMKEMKYKDLIFYSKHPALRKYKNFKLIKSLKLQQHEVSDYISKTLSEDKVYYFH